MLKDLADAKSWYKSAKNEVRFHHEMEARSVTPGQLFFNRELDDQLYDSWRQNCAYGDAVRYRGLVKVRSLYSTGGKHIVSFSMGELSQEKVLRDLKLGVLVPVSQAQFDGTEHPPLSVRALTQKMAVAGFVPRQTECGDCSWEDSSSFELRFDTWTGVESFLGQLDRNEVCGIITYQSGASQIMCDQQKYATAASNLLNTFGQNSGIQLKTISRIPEPGAESIDITPSDEMDFEP